MTETLRAGSQRKHARLPLHSLLWCIATEKSETALRELHDFRTVFRGREGQFIRLAEYLDELREYQSSLGWSLYAENAYSTVIDTFVSVEKCAKKLQSILEQLEDGDINPLTLEYQVARKLESLIYHQFQFALKDSRRTLDWSRYEWMLSNGKLTLILPKTLSGGDRRRWLESRFPGVNPGRPGEKERIQQEIDDHFRHISVDFGSKLSVEKNVSPRIDPIDMDGLVEQVAEVKVQRIAQQRPAVRRIGAANLKNLIVSVFEAIQDEGTCDERLAEEAGLSKATFSRFCGSRWNTSSSIPDLWRNTARIIHSNPKFREVAEDAGVWPAIKIVVEEL